MKSEQNDREIIRSGNFREQHFKLAQNAHIFKILRDGIYSDKALAVIREYWANARDEHVKHGKADLPVDITVPNYMSPYLKIRDYGKGLTKDEVADVYISYGTSTKTDSDDFIGALGIGSKSAFCYTSLFQVTSFIDGKATVYSCYIDESEMGKIALVSTTKSDEPDGVEISIPVNSSDFGLFQEKIKQLFKHSHSRPNVRGSSTFTFDEPVSIIKGDDWMVQDDPDEKSYCIMGDIPYIFDTNIFTSTYASIVNNLRKDEQVRQEIEVEEKLRTAIDVDEVIKYPANIPIHMLTMLKYNLVLRFEIGELEMAASREALSYKSKTILAIYNKLEVAAVALVKLVTDEINSCTSLWQIKGMYHKYFGSYMRNENDDILYNIMRDLGRTDIKWKGKQVTDNEVSWSDIMVKHPKPAFVLPPTTAPDGTPIPDATYKAILAEKQYAWNVMEMPETITCIAYYRNSKLKLAKDYVRDIESTIRADRFILNDTGTTRGIFTGMNALLPRVSNGAKYYVFDCADKNNTDLLIAFLSEIGVPLEYLSKIDIPKLDKNSAYRPSPKYSKKFFAYNSSLLSGKDSDKWDIADIDPEEEEGIYVVIDRYIPQFVTGMYGIGNLNTIKAFIEEIEKKPLTVYGVKDSFLPKLTSNWTRIDKYASELALKLLSEGNLEQALADFQHLEEHKNELPTLELFLGVHRSANGQLQPTSPINQIHAPLRVLIDNHKLYRSKEHIARVIGIVGKMPDIKPATPSYDMGTLKANFFSRYPMLRYTLDAYKSADKIVKNNMMSHAAEYVIEIDKRTVNPVANP